ncbi:hypothetical protein [Actinoplanes sp. GCM10030250]|uniref:hypothetical protein n=1 Tax=Actinoplanes sp. GCM10030250 TaxID=3273376 RepID=UPI00361E0481
MRLLLAAAVAALIASVTLIAPARAAVGEVIGGLLRVAGVEVRREHSADPLPPSPSPLPSSRSVALAEADRRAAFPVRMPESLGEPEEVQLSDPDQSGAPRVVTMIFRGGTGRFEQFDGSLEPAFFKTAPNAAWVELGSGADPGSGVWSGAVWLPGPHPVTYVGRDGVTRTETARLAGPTLIWASADSVTYRLEGIATLEEATEVARSVR